MSSQSTRTTKRRYKKRRRAELEAATRERITAAAVKLHGTAGPARTTFSAIAREAGVQRATVYRHFPNEEELFDACSAHYWARNPMPDPHSWTEIGDPAARLRRALGDLYGFFARTEPMLERTSRDAPMVEAMAKPSARFLSYLVSVGDAIIHGRRERGAAKRRVRAAVGHAVSFATWQSLVRQQGLENAEAVAVMAAMVESAGRAHSR
jgi:AcrR family transcriptional regulator